MDIKGTQYLEHITIPTTKGCDVYTHNNIPYRYNNAITRQVLYGIWKRFLSQVKMHIKEGKFSYPQLCPAFGLTPMGIFSN